MKKLRMVFLALVVMAVPVFIFTQLAGANNFRSGTNAIVKNNEVIDQTLFITGTNVEVGGEINGDVLCVGQNVTVTAKVHGDVLCAGQNVRVGGTVEGDVRLAGQLVSLTAVVDHNASLAGDTVTTEQSGKVQGDMQTIANVTTLNGLVGRDLSAAGNTIQLNSMIGRNVSAATEQLSVESNTSITGNLVYYSKNKLTQASQAKIDGTITQKQPTEQKDHGWPMTGMWSGNIMFIIMLLVLALMIVALFPRLTQSVSEHAMRRPGATFLTGLVAFIVAPALIIISFLTIIGMFVGFTLLLFWILVIILSGVFFSYYLGRLVMARSSQHPILVMVVGALLFALLLLIPIISVIACILSMVFGSGMIVRELWVRTPIPDYAPHPVSKTKKKTT